MKYEIASNITKQAFADAEAGCGEKTPFQNNRKRTGGHLWFQLENLLLSF